MVDKDGKAKQATALEAADCGRARKGRSCRGQWTTRADLAGGGCLYDGGRVRTLVSWGVTGVERPTSAAFEPATID